MREMKLIYYHDDVHVHMHMYMYYIYILYISYAKAIPLSKPTYDYEFVKIITETDGIIVIEYIAAT